MKIGQVVKVYDGDLVGFTTAVLLNLVSVTEDYEGRLERWRMETNDGTKLVRFVRNSYDAKKDGSGYLIKEEEEEKESFYCEMSGEKHYNISEQYYINTFKDEKYIDICYKNDLPESEGITIDREDILKIAKIIKQEGQKEVIELLKQIEQKQNNGGK